MASVTSQCNSGHLYEEAGLDVFSVEKSSHREFHVTMTPQPQETVSDLWCKLSRILQQNQATVLKQTVLGTVDAFSSSYKDLSDICGPVDWPLTWVEGRNFSGQPISGITAIAATGIPVERIYLENQVVGSVIENEDAKFCYFGNITSTDASLKQDQQTSQIFERILAVLAKAGMNFSNVFRTWYYLHDILGWYGDFNRVRTAFFRENHVFEGVVPASTGIGGKNPSGTCGVVELMAAQSKNGSMLVCPLPSPLQCSAIDYGSSFSRAVEIAGRQNRMVYISGTASIDPIGNTVHLEDTGKQIELTFQVVEAILKSRGLSFQDVIRSEIYFKDIKDYPLFESYCRKNNLIFPMIAGENTVCRDDLLFEMELDASN